MTDGQELPSSTAGIHCVTGAFGYSGAAIAEKLLGAGKPVRTLTNSPGRDHPLQGRVEVQPLAFDDPARLSESLRGVQVLYNTYWVRFNHRDFKFADAVENTERLFAAAKAAGVERVVHISITNPSEFSVLEYFKGKARLERALIGCGLSYAILRPAVLFGGADILINNIAWALRRLPFFAVFGDGEYKLQPIHVDDLAALAVCEGERRENRVVQAVGPETFTYRELAAKIGEIIGRPRRIVQLPPSLAYVLSRPIGWAMRDVLITWDEVGGLMSNLLYVEGAEPAGAIKLTEWAREHAGELGVKYASELGRRRDRVASYTEIQ